MGTYSYLVNQENKTLFELGKGIHGYDLDIFKINKPINLIKDLQEDIQGYLFSDEEILYLIIEEIYEGGAIEDYKDYSKQIAEKVMKFCDNKIVYFLTDNYDTYYELRRDYGYKQIDSIYINATND